MAKMKKNFKNLTPHPIVLDGETYPSEGSLRVSTETQTVGGTPIPLSISKFGQVENLPEEKRGTLYIVSRLVAEATKRKDFLIVNETIRDKSGKIIGCKSLSSVVITDPEELRKYILHWLKSDGEYNNSGLDRVTPLKELMGGKVKEEKREVNNSYFSKSSQSFKSRDDKTLYLTSFKVGGKTFYLEGVKDPKVLDTSLEDVSDSFEDVIDYIVGYGPKEKAIENIESISNVILMGEWDFL